VATEQQWEEARLAHEEFHKKRIKRLRETNDMLAPWEALPEIPRFSIGWRMGEGEDYLGDWQTWLRALSPTRREAYRLNHPETSSWEDIYLNLFEKFGEIEQNWDSYWDAELDTAQKRFTEMRRIGC
jgi:hypothetical protein